ncbi:MAG: hypothetical protein V1847_02145 [Candidatus Diapherotrites archaeon]
MPEELKLPAKVEARLLEQKELLKKSEISLWLDHYDDIFSDFDPRPYHERSLSDDFLFEARKASREMKGGLQLHFLVPALLRDSKHEEMIKKRLKEHFKKHAMLAEKEQKKVVEVGAGLAAFGFVLLASGAFIVYSQPQNIAWDVLLVILEPAGWFTAWTGLDQIFYEARKQKPELEFYQKMSKAEILFEPY